MSKKLYKAWKGMRQRCNNPRNKQYKDWGGRGIRICKRWNAYKNFAADMGPHPGDGLTLDRIDNNGDYKPSNCQWATRLQQNRNRNYVKLTPAQAEEIRRIPKGSRPGAAQLYGVARSTISAVRKGVIW
jgi:hypothetical protein